MRSLRFLPFTFIAGIHGFALFTPYLMFVGTVLLIAQAVQAASRRWPAPAVVRPANVALIPASS